ncbi:hypothetical protein PsorP6_019058 [Peronosclerospora sorghi]|nr:hypothetical protein PsorP6_019058 [Peronosclerospora sorghi]
MTNAATMNRAYAASQQFQLPTEQKQISTEQIQAMLDENSSLIVEIIELNTQIKHEKGTAQLAEFTEKLDKKRKNLNKNLMTLAKWADESSEASPRQPQAYGQPQMTQQQQQYARAGMMQMPMANQSQYQAQAQAQAQARAQAQAQAQARLQAQAQAQAQAYAQAQYQARINPMMAQQYGQMNSIAQQQQQQQQRFANGSMSYGVSGSGPMAHTVRMSNAMSMPTSYGDSRGVIAANMGFQVSSQGYGIMPSSQMQRMNPAAQVMPQQNMQSQSIPHQSITMPHQSMAMPQQSMAMPHQSMAIPQQTMAMAQQSMSMGQQGMPQQSMQIPQQGMGPMQMNGPPNSIADAPVN